MEQAKPKLLPATSTPHLSGDELDAWLAKRLATLQSAFPGQPLTVEANDLYLSEFELIFRSIGEAEFDAVISACIRECRFTPTLADIRERAGLNQEKTQESEAQQAWLTVISYLGFYGSEGRGIYRGRHETTGELIMDYPPELPPKIAYAVRLAGGLKAIEQTPVNELHFRRDDFLAGYKAYEFTKCFPLQLPEDMHHLLPGPALNTRRELRMGTFTAGYPT